jgi:TolB protein
VREVKNPVALDRGSLLAFAGVPHGGQQYQLAQLFLPTGELRERESDIVGLDSLSATADSRTLAAVRLDERASVWSVDKADFQAPRQLTSEVEKITSADWLGEDTLVYPSARSGSVNLVKLDLQGKIQPLAGSQSCVQTEPASAPGERTVVYASNCGSEGDDFNLWALDLAGGTRRRLTSGSNFDQQPEVSPDGNWVYYTSWSSNIPAVWKVPVTGGVPVRVLRRQAEAPVLSPDGSKFAAAVREDHGGWVIEIASTADGSILQRLPKLPIGRPLCWSPDGAALDYADADKTSAGIWRQPLAGGPAQLLLRVSEGTVSSLAWNRSGTTLAYVRARDQKDAVLFERALKR